VTTDPGGVYALLDFEGSFDFGCGPLIGDTNVDVALVRYDSSGNCLWSNRFGDSSAQFGVSAAADSTGVVITGTFSGSIDFGAGPLTSLGSSDVFVARFDTQGAPVWSTPGGGSAAESATGVALDPAGDALLIGTTAGSFTLGRVSMTSLGGTDGFVISLDSTGTPQWLRPFSGVGTQLPLGVASDSSNNVVVTGAFAQSMDLGTGVLTSQGMNDIFLAKFDSSGTTLWAESFGASGNDIGYAVATDSENNVWICGSYSGTVNFGSVTADVACSVRQLRR
jgi:hypothetical protein